VTVDGVGYDLGKELLPDPEQVIAVDVGDEPAPVDGTPVPIKLEVNDTLHVRTSTILDRNGNPVPDDTPVIFHAFYVEEQLERRVEALTSQGVAEAYITLELPGQIEIRATSEPATSSRPLLVVLGETTQILTPTPIPTPTPTPTATPTPTPTFTATPTPTPTPTPIPTVVPEPEPPPPPEPRLRWLDLILAVAGIAAAAGVTMVVAYGMQPPGPVLNPISRTVLLSVACGLLGYIYYGIGLPGSSLLDGVPPGLRGLLVGFSCGLLPLIPIVLLSRVVRRDT
jgi:hypothetical protein